MTTDPFTDWCADRHFEAEHLALNGLPADEYWTARDDGNDVLDRLDAALAGKGADNAA